jgi:hypothetical protein
VLTTKYRLVILRTCYVVRSTPYILSLSLLRSQVVYAGFRPRRPAQGGIVNLDIVSYSSCYWSGLGLGLSHYLTRTCTDPGTSIRISEQEDLLRITSTDADTTEYVISGHKYG